MQKGKRWTINEWLESLIQVSSEKSINIFNTKLKDGRSILGANRFEIISSNFLINVIVQSKIGLINIKI